jgi:hypothetical protein
MNEMRDEFLSEEDLDLATMSYDELEAWWNIWLEQAQITNNEDKNDYSHGVFSLREPLKIASLSLRGVKRRGNLP